MVEWQTRRTQNPVGATLCGFKSRLRHQQINKFHAGPDALSSGLLLNRPYIVRVLFCLSMDTTNSFLAVTAISCLLILANGYRTDIAISTNTAILKSSACVATHGDPVAQFCGLFSDVNSGEPFFLALAH